MRDFIRADRRQLSLLPPAIEDWLPEQHLARFVVEICDELDLSEIYAQYGSSGSTPYDPRMLVGLLFYGYSTGVFSSRKIEEATYDSVAFRFISGNHQPDHDTIANFRKRFLPHIEGLFVQILLLAHAMGFAKVGKVHIDGTKVKANASKHRAMSYAYIERLEQQFTGEVARLLELARSADQDDQGLDIPAEIRRREDRLAKLREAKAELQAQAQARHEQEKAKYEAKKQARAQREAAQGKKLGGREAQPPREEGPGPKDQYNFTDPESRIMKTAGGFDQCYNAQAAVNEEMLIVGAYANAHANDKEELLPTLDTIPGALGQVQTLAADTGYFSEANVKGALKRTVDPYIAVGRQAHNQWLDQHQARQQQGTAPPDPTASPASQMSAKLQTDTGRAIYRLRKMTVEPVFGIIKEILGFRRFSLRGEQAAHAEWLLVCTSYNLKRLFKLSMG
jgi:transposase